MELGGWGEGLINWSSGLGRIFDWGGGKLPNHMQRRLQKYLTEKLFVAQRYRRMKDQAPIY